MKVRSYLQKHWYLSSLNPTTLAHTHLLCSASSAHSGESWLSVPGNPLIKWPQQPNGSYCASLPPPPLPSLEQIPSPNLNPNYQQHDFTVICSILRDTSVEAGPALEAALDRTGIRPNSDLLQAVFEHFAYSPRLLYALFLWTEKQSSFQLSPKLFNSMINLLGKARDFDSAWSLVLGRIGAIGGTEFVSCDTFVIMIRRYTRAGMTPSAIRAFEYATSLDMIHDSGSETYLFEILLDSLCKEGHVRVASDYFNWKRELDPNWVPSIRIFNIILNGWFRSRKLKHAEKLWTEIKNTNVKPSVVTYGTIVEGYCRTRRVDKAISLVHEMRREGIEPNAIVYNPIIDALAEAGRFKEISGMMERFLLCESGPTVSTYNSLVKGLCKAKDLVGASKILKTMISKGFIPTPTTYNYFFRYFSKFGKIDESFNLYSKMIESGHNPDRLTYHLLMKTLCEDQRLDLAVQVSKEMRARGCDMDLATSTMLIHLLCKMHKLQEAFAEFEDMLRRGVIPQFLTFELLNNELKQQGMKDMAYKLGKLMSSVNHSTHLPDTYRADVDSSRQRRETIIRKAEAMYGLLKTCKDPRKLMKNRRLPENFISSANELIEDIRKRVIVVSAS